MPKEHIAPLDGISTSLRQLALCNCYQEAADLSGLEIVILLIGLEARAHPWISGYITEWETCLDRVS